MECWNQYEFIKWFHAEYPHIPVTIMTATIGHFIELATPEPYHEAEIIKDSWWGFHHLPANILVYYRNYFNMPDLDQRREDIMNENLIRYSKITGRPEVDIPPTLVGPDGRIITTFSMGYNAVRKSKEFLDPFYTWYQQTYRATAAAQ